MIETSQLRLIPTDLELARAELVDRRRFERLLGASVPGSWPPESLTDALPVFLHWLEAAPEARGWFTWYALTLSAAPVLVASAGFKGPPRDGVVEVGYSVLPEFQGRGYATEMACGLTRWALGEPGVTRIVAETEWANPASVRVLRKAGFVLVGSTNDLGGALFELVTSQGPPRPGTPLGG